MTNIQDISLTNGTTFLDKIISWAIANDIPEKTLPREPEKLYLTSKLVLTNINLSDISIPSDIWDLKNLDKLSFSNSQLEHISEKIGNLENLNILNLSNNRLTGLPSSILNLIKLTNINLSNNFFIKAPDFIGKIDNLTKLYLSNNQLKEIPESISNLSKLDTINLSSNELTIIPECIGRLENLLSLNLSYNQIIEIPDFIGNLNKLVELKISSNQLKKISELIGNLSNLVELKLSYNKLENIPESISNLHNLNLLFLFCNELIEIPKSIGNLSKLTVLDLSKNKLTKIPESIGELSKLVWLDLSSNHIKKIPDSIANLTNLTKLDLSNNNLSTIPEYTGNLNKLVNLNLSDNKLTEIPASISNLENIINLNLSNNRLTEIPEYVFNLKKLNTLDLTNNFLTKIPKRNANYGKLKIIGARKQLSIITAEQSVKLETEEISDTKLKEKGKKMTYQQKILFGSPGTGKSYKIDNEIIPDELSIDANENPENVIKTVFHPEYTYGDFIGKLVPITRSTKVEYNFYEGHFLKALAQAYKNIIAAHDKQGNQTEEFKNVALVIDEINRGNSAAIFGTTFQLLDRNIDGWSSYCVNVNEITFTRLFELCDLKEHSTVQGKVMTYKFGNEEIQETTLQTQLHCNFKNRTVKIPPNLSIIASMNTSDSSIYYMDSAFKRRWDWEFIDIDGDSITAQGIAFANREQWIAFVSKLNAFIKSNHKYIRGIEDKQIGHYFMTDTQIKKSSIQNKLMFFLWDSVFNRDKKPLIELLFGDNKNETLITFGDFAKQIDLFIDKINNQ